MSGKYIFTAVFLIGFLIVCRVEGFSQNTKRGFKLLEKAEYEKARELFQEALSENKENPTALLGISLILADEKSPFYNLIDAWKYARVISSHVEKMTPEETEFVGEYFYNTEERHISRPVKKKIEYAVETIEAKLIKYIREENNLEMVYTVLKEFPDFRYYDNVMHIRNQLEFRKYEKQHTLEGYLEFIKKFPDAAQIDKAMRYRNQLAFENACKVNTVEAYKNYLKNYPGALEVNSAIKKLHAVAYEQAKRLNTIQAFDQFIAEYPDALEVSDARLIQKQLLYEYAKKIKTLQAYNEFIRKYPDGQQYIDIFNLKSLDNGMRFLNAHPVSGSHILWARSFEEEANEELSACLAVDTLNSYIAGGTVFRTDTGSTDAWIIKTTADGKMVWNKYIGEQYNDEVSMLRVNRMNQIIGAGYTWLGRDSSSAESWLFKLGPDGQKIWSRKLGKMYLNDMTVSQNGSIWLAGYVVNDSLQPLYSVVVLNESGKRLWGRTYTGRGELIGIAECPDGKFLLAGNHWRAKIDAAGYIGWESAFNATDSILASVVLPKGEICYLGFRNHSQIVFIKTTADNKQVVDKVLAFPEIKAEITSLVTGGPQQIIALISFEEHQSVNWINTLNGEITTSSRLPNGTKMTGLKMDRNNNLLIEACNGEIVLIKNSGPVF